MEGPVAKGGRCNGGDAGALTILPNENHDVCWCARVGRKLAQGRIKESPREGHVLVLFYGSFQHGPPTRRVRRILPLLLARRVRLWGPAWDPWPCHQLIRIHHTTECSSIGNLVMPPLSLPVHVSRDVLVLSPTLSTSLSLHPSPPPSFSPSHSLRRFGSKRQDRRPGERGGSWSLPLPSPPSTASPSPPR